MKSIILKNKNIVIVACIFNIMASLVVVITSLMLTNLLNAIIARDVKDLIKQTILLLLGWGVLLILDYMKSILSSKAIARMNSTLRYEISEKLTKMDYEEFYSEETGSYVSWLTNDISQIENLGFSSIFTIVYGLATVVFSLGGLFFIHYWVAISSIIMLIIMSVVPKLMNKTIEKYSKNMSIQQEEFVKVTKETISGHEILYSYNLLSRLKNNISKGSEALEGAKYTFRQKQTLVSELIGLTNIFSQIGINFITGYLSVIGLTSIGNILPAGSLAGTFFCAVSNILRSRTAIQSTKPIFEKFNIDNVENNGKVICPEFNKSIELRNLDFSYEAKKVLKDVSLTFEKDKKYAIIGASGSGKSTLIKLILGHLRGYKGNICIDNKDIKLYDSQSIRDNIAYISQDVYVFSGTIEENITLNESFSKEEMDRALKESCLNEFVYSLEDQLNTVISEDGNNLSGGQKQRIAIARALIRKKPVLIIDEGTSALDKKNAMEVESALLKNENLTVLLITHHLNEELMDDFDEVVNL